MKKIFIKLCVILSSSVILGVSIAPSTLVYAESNNSDSISMTETDIDPFEELANLSFSDILYILEQENINPNDVFSSDEINKELELEKQKELFTPYAGVNRIFRVNDSIRDVYINSYIATTLKYVGFAAIGKYLSGWKGVAVGSVGANINTSRGLIVRYQKRPGWEFGVSGYVWAIISARSQ